MIAWKWTLNNKDVTAVIAPKQSETASINNLAIRIMKLAKENSKRFVATRAKRDKLQKAIDETTATLNQKTAYNSSLMADIDDLREQIKQVTQAIDDKAKMTDRGDAMKKCISHYIMLHYLVVLLVSFVNMAILS